MYVSLCRVHWCTLAARVAVLVCAVRSKDNQTSYTRYTAYIAVHSISLHDDEKRKRIHTRVIRATAPSDR